ncbi:MAG: mandelate racemase/muconate lactonizing enzyme family protein [Acidobacteriota bacterium]|nr:mandelate racemase/muconate lactonizing enzyme family protein [Bryobacteraceae bacterium CoA2 C42]MCA2965993.1 mandelate racemase/muconate lactonizing enzyme family protein [Acidobacteriaceae bacterium]
MKITKIETLRLQRGVTVHAGPIQWLWVLIHTDTGLSGLGETYPHPAAEEAVVHSSLAPRLLGQDPSRIDRLWASMFDAISYSGWAGAEMRAISAIDMALWDLAGKAAGLPVYQLLGGASRDRIRTYNTCYDHLSFLTEPVELAASLLAEGISAMKIWPLDPVAKETGGHSISAEQLRRGLEPLRLIKKELGDRMDVAMEFHGYWNLPCAIRIARACEEYEPMWLEEMLPQDNLAAYRELASATRLPLTISERLMTRWQYRELLGNQAARTVMPDISWVGGISEARKIANMAETWYLPVAPHNCGGPVLHAASLHLAANLTNLQIVESVRRHYADEYRELVGPLPAPQEGHFALPAGPGLGISLNPALFARPDAVRRETVA